MHIYIYIYIYVYLYSVGYVYRTFELYTHACAHACIYFVYMQYKLREIRLDLDLFKLYIQFIYRLD